MQEGETPRGQAVEFCKFLILFTPAGRIPFTSTTAPQGHLALLSAWPLWQAVQGTEWES